MRLYPILALMAAFPALALAEPLRTKHVTADLLLENQTLQPGRAGKSENWIGLRLEMIPHWHTYWRFPGDSGLPTEVEWTLPAGWRAGPAHWPIPQRLFIPPLVNYGFEKEAMLAFQLEIPEKESEGTKRIGASVSWLVCKEECIPEKGQIVLDVKVSRVNPKPATFARYFNELRSQQPSPLPAGASAKVVYKEKMLGIELEGVNGFANADFFPLAPQIVKGDAPPNVEEAGNKTTLWLEKSDPFDRKAVSLPGMIVQKGESKIYELSVPLPPAPHPAISATSVNSREENAPSSWLLVIFAFLGGLILNLMPCVFPVLGIKVMSLIRQGQGNLSHARRHGHAYALGVVACFWALAAALLVLRHAGQSVGWGFQLQQPGFVTFLIFLFSLVAADLAGYIHWSGRWMGAGSKLADREGAAGSFFTGVLAVVVATPCSAPFMGTAIGAAISEPSWIFFLIFTALGLGLAVPFVVLCYMPWLLKALPKPGEWMERLKELFAIPIVATVLWLLWVLTLQIGADGALLVELGLLVVMVSVWARRRFIHVWVHTLGWVLLLAGILIAVSGTTMKPSEASDSHGSWKRFSDAAVEEAIRAGQPVFIDFTAAWCLTCQINKKLVLDRSEMQEYLKEKGVVLFLADWTNRDPEITRALEQHGRIGVPLYLVYGKGEKSARVLPQVLTSGIVREAFP